MEREPIGEKIKRAVQFTGALVTIYTLHTFKDMGDFLKKLRQPPSPPDQPIEKK